MPSTAPPSGAGAAATKPRLFVSRRRITLSASLIAIIYGLLARLFFGFSEEWNSELFSATFAVMSVAFIFGVPFAIGFSSTYLGHVRSLLRALFFPWVPALSALVLSLALAWEGLICIFLWLPLVLLLSSLGGLCGSLALRLRGNPARRSVFGAVLLFPYGLGLLEVRAGHPDDFRTVDTHIDIDGDAASVWKHIVEVPAIRDDEHHFSWSHFIGFPKPVAATVEGRGVGTTREASFERGVLFLEKVTEYREGERLSFTIHADPNQIPSRALDQHVTVGGPYFDVLTGTYQIEELGERRVRLHLSSEHRLSTRFNPYASAWTDFIMRDTQEYILRIVKARAEAEPGDEQD